MLYLGQQYLQFIWEVLKEWVSLIVTASLICSGLYIAYLIFYYVVLNISVWPSYLALNDFVNQNAFAFSFLSIILGCLTFS